MIRIKIATDYDRAPGARYELEGPYSGERFRTEILYPKLKEALKNNDKLEVNLDGTAGLGTSFLEESFGGLIRVNKLSYSDIMNCLVLISERDADYIDEINEYLKDAYENEK